MNQYSFINSKTLQNFKVCNINVVSKVNRIGVNDVVKVIFNSASTHNLDRQLYLDRIEEN